MAELDVRAAEQIAEQGSGEEVVKQLQKMVSVDRRVVARKETIGYMLYDGAQGFNIDSQKELFVDSILKISLPKQALFNAIAGVWDVVDDLLMGVTEVVRADDLLPATPAQILLARALEPFLLKLRGSEDRRRFGR